MENSTQIFGIRAVIEAINAKKAIDKVFIQKGLKIPVIGVGGVKTAKYINKVICEKQVEFLAVGRAILADVNWGVKQGLI